ncbi:MAG TPA: GAF domain-containing protein [Nocardioides sp.]|jgi:GAF domain-containing protein|uniref:GAF domain-containing protein n=1 Tax=Nocardioides sp. TaxID=35761 RepID=UPI002E343B60|nr:GAF domain-containing protein [Nocardioides sp.]HEX3930730.1 GAF domain-containing protein [Nocardioides sp.]
MTTAPDVDPALGRCVEATRALFGAAACSIALVDPEGETLAFVASDGAGSEEIVGVSIPVSRGIAGWAAMSGQPIAVRDVVSDARFARDVAESTHYVPTAILAAPIVDPGGEVLGVLSVLDPVVDEASDWTLNVLGTIAGLLAMLLDRMNAAGTLAEGEPLARLGSEVLRLVESWGSRPGGHR